jgi:RNA polymerase-associated protein RTF1
MLTNMLLPLFLVLLHLPFSFFAWFRFESSDKDEDNHGDGYESEFSYGSDLYKDDEDRDRLAAMTELEREMELAERGEKRDTWLALRKSRGARQAESSRPRERGHRDLGPPSSRMRSSVKESTRSKKESALHELVARRQRAQDPGLQQKRRDSGPVSRSKEAGSPQRRKARESVSYRYVSWFIMLQC